MSSLTTFSSIFVLFLATRALTHACPPQKGNRIRWVDCTMNVPEPIQVALNITTWDTSVLGQLPSTLCCGRIDVPLDYGRPFSENNKIAVAFSLYTPKNPAGTIFYNPGGPGDEAQSYAWNLATNTSQLFAPLNDYQFMMMDTRGNFGSSPLNCSLGAYKAIPFGAPQDHVAFEEYRAKSAALADSCLQNSTPRGSVEHIGTQETVQDWESIRIALGKKSVSLIGLSYGTYFFAEYVQRFPNSIQCAALDAVTVRGKPDVDAIKDEITAVNRMLLRADAFCATNSSCPFHSLGKGAVVDAWKELLAKAKAGELSANITVKDIRQTIPALMRGTPKYDILMGVMALALLQGEAGGLAVPAEVDAAFLAGVPLFCPDDNIDNNSLDGFKAIEATTAPLDPNDFQTSFFWQAKLDCSNWIVQGRPKVGLGSVSDFPFLWITSDFDLNTPTEWANFNHDQTPKSTLVARHGDGHGSLSVLGPARDAIIEYIRTGRVPPSSNETLATVFGPGVTRNASHIPDPYSVGFGKEQGDVDVLQ